MQPRMSPGERGLLEAHLRRAQTVVEYGCGGSTFLALEAGVKRIRSVETDPAWISRLAAEPDIRSAVAARRLELLHADIGEVADWGMPADKTFSTKWVDYPMCPWRDAEMQPDFVLVDGRWRVASALTSALMTNGKALIAIHDLDIRPQYRPALALLDEVERVDGFGVYRLPTNFDPGRVLRQIYLSWRDYM